ncbi:uncharacterized protein BDZ83DRAFT_98998 [Colletotrichum acutatum]|uniref:Uncharacterized protein n=1 Tax=Glomerella acutata TaxID=27357 RepID=A0AAD8URM7_GLOAC|nr:uncharacterized protein BDZ83DRAFT_98998 [Colletotrichum acutatum]KAK1728721.1 hypothetical protein BDZ83DRAFT_98998 [Colletotrichum acutatum]
MCRWAGLGGNMQLATRSCNRSPSRRGVVVILVQANVTLHRAGNTVGRIRSSTLDSRELLSIDTVTVR